MLFSSLTSCDPGDIFVTFAKLQLMKIQVSVISLSAAIFVLQQVSDRSDGHFCLAKDKDHFEELL